MFCQNYYGNKHTIIEHLLDMIKDATRMGRTICSRKIQLWSLYGTAAEGKARWNADGLCDLLG